MVQVPRIVKRDDDKYAVVILSPDGSEEEVLSDGLTEEQAEHGLDGALQALEYDGE